jgi:hypothetical protein
MQLSSRHSKMRQKTGRYQMTGIRKTINTALVAAIICGCLGMAMKRLIYIHEHFTLKGLIDHEKNHE